MVVVALASPNVPVTTCAEALPPAKKHETASAPRVSFRKPAPKSIVYLLIKYFWVSLRLGGLRWVGRRTDPSTCLVWVPSCHRSARLRRIPIHVPQRRRGL